MIMIVVKGGAALVRDYVPLSRGFVPRLLSL